MSGLIRVEWKKIFLPVLFTTIILSIVMSVLSCTLYRNYSLHYDLEAWEVGTEFLSLLFPLLTVVPLCWNLYYEGKDNFLLYVMPRVPIKSYLMAKWLAYAAGSFCIMTIPCVLSAVCALYINEPGLSQITAAFSHVFQSAFTQLPLLYAVALSFWRGFIGILVMTFGFTLALYCKNVFVVLTGPFMYAILENFILAICHLEAYRLVVAFDPTSISSDAVSAVSFIAGPVLLLLVISMTAFFFGKMKRHAIVSA